MKAISIRLTEPQKAAAEWLLGCPLFQEKDSVDDIAYSWDEPLDVARSIAEARDLTKIEGDMFLVGCDENVLGYLIGDADRLASMSAKEYAEDLLVKGESHKSAQCKANAAVRAASNLRDKLADALKEIKTTPPPQ